MQGVCRGRVRGVWNVHRRDGRPDTLRRVGQGPEENDARAAYGKKGGLMQRPSGGSCRSRHDPGHRLRSTRRKTKENS